MKTKKFKLFVFIMAFFIMVTFSILISKVEASSDCPICTGDKSTYPMEKQFYERIQALKDKYGKNKIDEIALAATVLHRENFNQAARARYNKDYSRSSFSSAFSAAESGEVSDNKEESEKLGLTETQVDKLTAAAIIMAASAGSGSYNEDKYKEALANENFFGDHENILCGVAALHGLFSGESDSDSEEAIKWTNRENICKYGYVGTVYNLTEIEDDDVRHIREERSAQEIIDFIHYYYKLTNKKRDMCAIATSGDFATWKQYGETWSSVIMGGGGSIAKYGCYVTSIAIQAARSGTAVVDLPSGYDSFNPGAFVTSLNQNGGLDDNSNFTGTGFQKIIPNWKLQGNYSLGTGSKSVLAKKLSDVLSTGVPGDGGKEYQKFLVLQIHHYNSDQHWVAVDSVTGNEVTIFDPGAQGNTLDDNYSGWYVDSYSVFYATDIEFGKTGTSTSGLASCGAGTLEDLMTFINNFEGGTTCNDGTGYTTSTLPNDPGGLTASNGVTLGTAKYYQSAAGISDIESEYATGCPNKEKMDKIKMAILQSMYDEVGASAEEKGVTLSEQEHLALTSVRYGGYGMDRDIMDQIKQFGHDSYEVFHCFVSLGCGFGNASYMDGLANRRAGEYELFRTGNTNVHNVGKGYSYYQAITNKAQLEHYMQTDWPTGSA